MPGREAIFWTRLFLTNPGGIRDEVERQAFSAARTPALRHMS
jgi:hypothetical protein